MLKKVGLYNSKIGDSKNEKIVNDKPDLFLRCFCKRRYIH